MLFYSVKKRLKKVGLYVGVSLSVMLVIGPLYWLVSSAFKTPPAIIKFPPDLIPKAVTLGNFRLLFSQTPFLTYLKNTIITSGFSTFLSVCLASVAAYSCTRFRYRGSRLIPRMSLLLYMVPRMLLIFPLFLIMYRIGLINTYAALIISYMAFSLPFLVYLLVEFFKTIPIEIEEAALIDGANRGQIFFRIVLPLALPGIIAASIFSFIWAWNDYLFASILMGTPGRYTMTVGIVQLRTSMAMNWAHIMAASTLFTIPSLVFFIIIQKPLIQGATGGAVKG